MEYTTLGESGLEVSQLGLGTMAFSEDGEGWQIDREEAISIVERAVELGITFFDTANIYSGGESEAILGDALAEHDRDLPVIATKVHGQMDGQNPNASGLSRKAIEQELEHSLDRLGVDTIDLYQIHRWDDATPIEETLRTLDDAVRRNQVRYLGASSMWAYQLGQGLHTSEQLDLERFVSMQNHYNLVYREEEREMNPFCEEQGLGLTPWSPLARGFLARPLEELNTTVRSEEDSRFHDERMEIYRSMGGDEINERVSELADERGISMAQISLSWLLHKNPVSAPIVGITSVEHLEDAVEAVDIDLSESDLEYLEDPYEPVPITGHS